jgi:hypothetical protein
LQLDLNPETLSPSLMSVRSGLCGKGVLLSWAANTKPQAAHLIAASDTMCDDAWPQPGLSPSPDVHEIHLQSCLLHSISCD